MTEEQQPTCSGVAARPIFQAAFIAADMTLHRSRRAEFKRVIVKKIAGGL
jgi:hypothetical protein